MSTAALDFLKKANQDPVLQKELRATLGDPKAGIPAKDFIAFAAGKGYKFSVEELQDELAEDRLGSVSGGGTIYMKWEHEILIT